MLNHDLTSPTAPVVRTVLERLYADTLRRDPVARRLAAGAGTTDESDPAFYHAMQDAYMPVTPDAGLLLYQLCLAAPAGTVVEYGTSYGISTIHLAAAVRRRGAGRVISTELVAAKAAQARHHLAQAQLADLVDVRVGDALATLATDPPHRIGMLLLDGAKRQYLPLLRQLEPHLLPGALIVADNVAMAGAADFVEHVLDSANGYHAATLYTRALGEYHPLLLATLLR
ncbi:MAG TPA: class I SAM-dependent methyltransferase [Pseudoduganella sp.]|jgi:predicted O-methyltransferase YrrM